MARSVEMQLSRIFADVAIRRVSIPFAALLVVFSSGPCRGFLFEPWGIAIRGCYGKMRA